MPELTEHKSPAASRSPVLWLTGGLVSLLILYALSPLPVCWIFFHSEYGGDLEATEWLL